jgi:hypothetical protein
MQCADRYAGAKRSPSFFTEAGLVCVRSLLFQEFVQFIGQVPNRVLVAVAKHVHNEWYPSCCQAVGDSHHPPRLTNDLHLALNRNRDGGHLLFRPVGLSILIQAVKLFTDAGKQLRSVLRHASEVPMMLDAEPWTGLLWDPTNRRMIVPSENQRVAMRVLFYGLGGQLSRFNSSRRQLSTELAGVLGNSEDDVVVHRWSIVP